MIKTKQVKDRRTLRFESLADIVADAEALAQRQPIRTTGNWTAAQIVGHIAIFIEWSLDGFPFTAPLPMRAFGRLIRGWAQRKTAPTGLSAPKGVTAHEPPADYPLEAAVARLRNVVARIASGERMTHASPLFGALSHEAWERLHCRHAEMHFSFMHPA